MNLPNMPQYLFVAICMLLQLYCLAMLFLTVNIFQTSKQPTLSTQSTVRLKRMLLNDTHEGNNAS